MPRVSVVIPTLDRKEFLEQAVETVRLQTHEPLECIVVDDGSTDGTREFLESLSHEELRTVYHDENRGQSVARNAGIDAATGEYVLFLDSDDILYPFAAEKLLESLDDQPEDCVGAFASTKLVNSRGRARKRSVPEGPMTEATLDNVKRIGGTSCTMFRRDVLEEVDGFDETLSRRVDLDLYLKILNRYALFGVDEVCCERRIHDGGISNDREEVEESYRKMVEKHQLENVKHDDPRSYDT